MPRTTTYFVHKDHLGSTRLVSGVNQAISDNLDFLPFGEQYSGSSVTTHKFTGDERDSETSLDHTLFRKYSSQLGRWTSPDPLGGRRANPQSLNRYAYVLNNPLPFVDPLGLSLSNAGRPKPGPGCLLDVYGNCHITLDRAGMGMVTMNIFGYTFWDALMGAPGTFISRDFYGNYGWGWDYGLYSATWNYIDGARVTHPDPGDLGSPYNDLSLPTTGYQVFTTDWGTTTVTSGFIPEFVAAQVEGARLAGPPPQAPGTLGEAIDLVHVLVELGWSWGQALADMAEVYPEVFDYTERLAWWYDLWTPLVQDVFEKYPNAAPAPR
jgi:RHS repeat-associated protein